MNDLGEAGGRNHQDVQWAVPTVTVGGSKLVAARGAAG